MRICLGRAGAGGGVSARGRVLCLEAVPDGWGGASACGGGGGGGWAGHGRRVSLTVVVSER